MFYLFVAVLVDVNNDYTETVSWYEKYKFRAPSSTSVPAETMLTVYCGRYFFARTTIGFKDL